MTCTHHLLLKARSDCSLHLRGDHFLAGLIASEGSSERSVPNGSPRPPTFHLQAHILNGLCKAISTCICIGYQAANPYRQCTDLVLPIKLNGFIIDESIWSKSNRSSAGICIPLLSYTSGSWMSCSIRYTNYPSCPGRSRRISAMACLCNPLLFSC